MTSTKPQQLILKGKKPYKSWLKDGVNGGPSSMAVLVEWLSYKPNYIKWKREDYSIDRVPKKELLEEIIDKLRQVGIYHRLAKDVASKISTLQRNYRISRQWHETEGRQLLQLGHCRKTIYDELIKRFPYWETLHPIFSKKRSLTTKMIAPISARLGKKDHYDTMIYEYIQNCRKREQDRMRKHEEMMIYLREKQYTKLKYTRDQLKS